MHGLNLSRQDSRRLALLGCILLLASWPLQAIEEAVQTITPTTASQVVELHNLLGHTRYVRDVAFSPDGTRLASAGDDYTIKIWDVETGDLVHAIPTLTIPAYINALAFSPDGALLSCPAGVFDTQSFERVADLPGNVSSTAFSPDGGILAVGAIAQPVKLLNVEGFEVFRTFESLAQISPTADDSFGFEFSPDGSLLADGTLNEGVARLWDVERGTLLESLVASQPGTDVHDISFSPDGSLLAAGGQGDAVVLFRVEDGSIDKELPTGEGTMTLDFSPDGQLLAISCEGRISLWDVERSRPLRYFSISGSALPVAFSPDGRHIAAGVYGGTVVIWGLRD